MRDLFGVLCLRGRNLGLAVFGEQIVESLGHKIVQRRVCLHRQNLELVAHLLREVDGDGTRSSPALLRRRFCFRRSAGCSATGFLWRALPLVSASNAARSALLLMVFLHCVWFSV